MPIFVIFRWDISSIVIISDSSPFYLLFFIYYFLFIKFYLFYLIFVEIVDLIYWCYFASTSNFFCLFKKGTKKVPSKG